jgi:uncharacterized OB-fold protein
MASMDKTPSAEKTSKPPKTGTVVCDGDRCVIGQYKPTTTVKKDGTVVTKTAHSRLASAAGMENPVVAGAIKPDGTIALKSETVNTKSVGQCDAEGTPLGDWAKMKMATGDIVTKKQYKAKVQDPAKEN